MIKWKDDYLVGVEEIDLQHKELFRIAGDAYELLKNEFYIDKYDRVVKIIEELKDYAVFHFQSEEKYMASIGYKKLLSHKVIHDGFIEEVTQIDLKKMDDNQDDYLSSIIMFVVDWIEKHILGTDKLIVL